MATPQGSISASIRTLLFCLGSALTLAGCGAPPADTTADPASPESQIGSEAVGSQVESPRDVMPDVSPAPAPKTLDLSRGSNFDDMIDSTSIDSGEQTELLPDLFAEQGQEAKARASGRILMSEDKKALTESIEGVELKLEVPVN